MMQKVAEITPVHLQDAANSLVNRRGVPTSIGTLNYRSTMRWRGHSWTLIIHTQQFFERVWQSLPSD